MADLEQAVQARLAGYAGLASLVAARIYPLVLPQKPTYPTVTYQRITSARASAMGSDPGVASVTIQVDAWGSTYANARAVAAQVRAALQRWRGTQAISGGSVEVLDSFIESDQDIYEEETATYRVRMDFLIWHRE